MTIMQLPEFSVECPPSHVPGGKITFAGEAPGTSEVTWKVCGKCGYGRASRTFMQCPDCHQPMKPSPQGFVGGSGSILRKMCENVGIDFSKCSRTNLVKRQPPNNNFSFLYLDAKRKEPTKELEWWTHLFIAELKQNRPNVLVACGAEVLKALCGVDKITNWQGSILTSNVIPQLKVIPILHPAYIMRDNWEWYYITQRYLRRIKDEAISPAQVRAEPPDTFLINPNLEVVLEFLQRIQLSHQPWYIDIETRGDSLHCIGLFSAVLPTTALCVPIQDSTGPHWSPEDEAKIYVGLSLAMRDNKLLRNQNIIYDLDYLMDMGCEPSGIDFDPMIGMNVAYPEFDKGLNFTTSLYTLYPYYKDEGKTWGKRVPDQQVWTYNCKDMVTTPKVSNAIISDLTEKKLMEVYKQRSLAFIPIAVEMQRNRLRLNKQWHSTLAGYLADERIKAHQRIIDIVGRDINVRSSAQIIELLYQEMKLPEKKKRGTNRPTVDELALKELRVEHADVEVLKLIIEERHLRTKESNYINVDFDRSADGSLYLPYMPVIGGTKTGRWSFTKSPKWRGSSPQTISKVMRIMYEPPPGSVFWQRDLSQAEARIVAWLSNCRFLLDVFASPIKIHKLVGGRIFRKPPEDIISDSLEYDTAKSVVHAYNYMMQYKRLAIEANVAMSFAKQVLEIYGMEVPEVHAWHLSIKEEAKTKGRLVTPMGRVRECYKACAAITNTGQLPDEILRDLVSYIPQSTVPDILNEGMLRVWKDLPWVFWHQQGHDSYLCSGPPDRTEEVYEAAEKAADVHFNINGMDCCIPGEFQWGYLWGAMLKYKPGEDTSYEAWLARATSEGYFEEAKIKEKLYSLF